MKNKELLIKNEKLKEIMEEFEVKAYEDDYYISIGHYCRNSLGLRLYDDIKIAYDEGIYDLFILADRNDEIYFYYTDSLDYALVASIATALSHRREDFQSNLINDSQLSDLGFSITEENGKYTFSLTNVDGKRILYSHNDLSKVQEAKERIRVSLTIYTVLFEKVKDAVKIDEFFKADLIDIIRQGHSENRRLERAESV